MKFFSSKISILFAVILLSACGTRIQPVPIDQASSWTDIVPLNTVIQIDPDSPPVDLNAVLASEETLRRALDTLFPGSGNVDNLRERIGVIRGAKDNPDRPFELLTGLGGLFAHEFLDAAEATLDERGNFDRSKRVYEFFYGQTEEFAYDNGNGSGRIVNTTYFTTVTIPLGVGPIISTTDSYRWDVEVDPGGFSVVPKDPSDPSDPFPGTLAFTPAMLNRINALGFQYKLWAKGPLIDIVAIEFKPDGASDYSLVPPSDPRYDRTPSNCIDMLFVNFPPPALGTLQPPLYCLGRCDNPMLINTGT